jgi:Zn-dependent peptidase ImmA (M78 family)
MVALMERIGIIVGSITMNTTKLDGLCNWSRSEDRPHVLLANDKMSFPRRQMDAAHELAHAVLHRDVPQDELDENLKMIERQAFRLGSALLMPSTSYPLEVRLPSLASFATLKERWRISIKAQIKRLADLEHIPPEYATQLYKLYSAKGWSKEEPLDRQWPVQEPHVLADALKLIADAGVRSKADLLAVEFTMSAPDIENLCNLPAGWFSRDRAEVVQLRAPPGNLVPTSATTGAVLSFPSGRPIHE